MKIYNELGYLNFKINFFLMKADVIKALTDFGLSNID